MEPWPPEPALRTLPAGAASAGLSPALVGIEEERRAVAPPQDLCAALFEDPAAGVPVAFFTDHYCPNCRSMAETLGAQAGIAITRHELPILGPDSVAAARAALAAGLQGAREAYHRRMRRAAFSPTEAYLRSLAEGLGIDPGRFLADARGREVDAALRRDLDLAAALGFGAVPTTVVGRTVVVGDIPAGTLARLVEIERSAGPPCPLRG